MVQSYREGSNLDNLEICALGYSDIAALMMQAIGVNNKGHRGGTPTYWATHSGLEEVVRALVTARADLNKANDNEGRTPLFIASLKGHLPVVQCLVIAGCTMCFVVSAVLIVAASVIRCVLM